jgi:hypothetical protein
MRAAMIPRTRVFTATRRTRISAAIILGANVGLLFFLGCAPQVKYAWFKDGATTSEFNKEKYRCMQESTRSAAQSSPVYNYATGRYMGQQSSANQYVDNGMFSACMQASGWELREQPR